MIIGPLEADLARWVERRKAEQLAARRARAATMRRLRVLTPLPLTGVWLHGPRWWRFCRDSQPDPDRWRKNVYDFADDVRELVCEEIRFHVYAEWSDPRERWG